MTLVLSNPVRASLVDGTATGSISNTDPMPRALMARFGRTVAGHVVERIEARLAAPRAAGLEAQVAGRQLRPGLARELAREFLHRLGAAVGTPAAGTGAGSPMGAAAGSLDRTAGMAQPAAGRLGLTARPLDGTARSPGGLFDGGLPSMGVGGEQLLTGSSFAVTRETRRGGLLSFWSRGAQSSFAGRAGALGLDGDVRTTMVGADYATGPMIVGLSLAHSRSLGDYHSHSAQNQLRIAVSTLEDRRAAGRLHDGRRPTAICQRCNTPKASVYNAIQSLTRLVVSRKYSGIGEEKARGRPRRGYPNSAIDSTNRTRSICREIGSFL